jgi:hypothetical protein
MPAVLIGIGRDYTTEQRRHSAQRESRNARANRANLSFHASHVLLALRTIPRTVLDVAESERAKRERESGGETADLLTATVVAGYIGVNVSTLIKWLDMGDPKGGAPSPIVRGGRYVFRPSVVAPWLEARGYFVPASLYERAAAEKA